MIFKIITPERLKDNLTDFIRSHYRDSFQNLKKHIFLNIDQELFQKFKKKEITEEEIKKLISDFEISNKSLKMKLENVKKQWRKNKKTILKNIKKVTNIDIFPKNIICYIDPYTNLGFYGEDYISVSIKQNISTILMIITHEIFHIFYWKKIKKLGLSKDVPEKSTEEEWKLSEIVVYIVLTEESLSKLWPEAYMNLYPELQELYPSLYPLWQKYDFDNFLIKSYDILNKNG